MLSGSTARTRTSPGFVAGARQCPPAPATPPGSAPWPFQRGSQSTWICEPSAAAGRSSYAASMRSIPGGAQVRGGHGDRPVHHRAQGDPQDSHAPRSQGRRPAQPAWLVRQPPHRRLNASAPLAARLTLAPWRSPARLPPPGQGFAALPAPCTVPFATIPSPRGQSRALQRLFPRSAQRYHKDGRERKFLSIRLAQSGRDRELPGPRYRTATFAASATSCRL